MRCCLSDGRGSVAFAVLAACLFACTPEDLCVSPAPHGRLYRFLGSRPSAGDLGGYKFRPGSRECFARGRDFLAGFGVPTTLVTGNHE